MTRRHACPSVRACYRLLLAVTCGHLPGVSGNSIDRVLFMLARTGMLFTGLRVIM